MKIINKISTFLNNILGYITFVAFFVIMAFIVLNVIMRYALNSPILGAYEIVEQMMCVGVFCSFAYAQQQGAHIRVTMFLMHMPRKLAMIVCSFTGICGTVILAITCYAVQLQLALAFNNSYTTAMLRFVTWPFYALEMICFAIFALAMLVNTIEYIIGIFNEDKAKEMIEKM